MHLGKILAIGAHPDDIEFGCGATLINQCTHALVLSSGGQDTHIKALRYLGITEVDTHDFPNRRFHEQYNKLSELFYSIDKAENYDIVFLPSSTDFHQDHRTVHQAGIRAFKDRAILGYEIPWDNRTFSTDVFVPVDEEALDLKLRSLKHYELDTVEHGHATPDIVMSLAKTRGIQIRVPYAEAFECIRMIL